MQRAGNPGGAARKAQRWRMRTQHGRRTQLGRRNSGITCQVRRNYSGDLDMPGGRADRFPHLCHTGELYHIY